MKKRQDSLYKATHLKCPKRFPTASLVGNDPTERHPEQGIGSKRVKKMLKTLPKTIKGT